MPEPTVEAHLVERVFRAANMLHDNIGGCAAGRHVRGLRVLARGIEALCKQSFPELVESERAAEQRAEDAETEEAALLRERELKKDAELAAEEVELDKRKAAAKKEPKKAKRATKETA